MFQVVIGDIEIDSVPVPSPNPGSVIIEVRATGV